MGAWEDTMKSLAGTDVAGGSVDRGDVAKPGNGDWVTGYGVSIVDASTWNWDKPPWDVNWLSDAFQVTTHTTASGNPHRDDYVPAGSSTGVYYVVAHCNTNWSDSGMSDNSKWSKFVSFPRSILPLLVNSPHETLGSTSLPSFDAAAAIFGKVSTFITNQQKYISDWAKEVDSEDSDFQGSAAGELRSYLDSLGTALGDLQHQINWPNDPVAAINAASTALRGPNGFLALQNAYNAWYPVASPVYQLKLALRDAICGTTGGKPTVKLNSLTDYSITTFDGKAVNSQDFFNAVETSGKNYWINSIVTNLDAGVTTYAKVAAPAFTAVKSAVDKTLTVQSPKGTAITPPGGGDGGGGDGGGGGGGAGGGDGGGGAPPPPNVKDLGPGAGGGGGNNPNLHMPPPPPTVTDLGPGGGQQRQQLLGPDGQPLPGMTAPPGSHIDANGHVIGPDGKPVLGPDGKPEIVPKGSTIGPPIASSFGGGPYMVPAGSHVDDNGMVIGPDGKPVLDRNGNRVYAGKGAKIDKDGKVLDPNGNPVDDQSQLLADEEHAMGDSISPLNPNLGGGGGIGYLPPPHEIFGSSPLSSGLGGFSGDSYAPSISGLGGGLGGEFGAGLAGTSSRPLPAGSISNGEGVMALSPRAVASGATLSPKEIAAQEAAQQAQAERAAASEQAEEAQMMGRSVATTGGAGMPPMMPPGGAGAGAGAGQNDKERQRTTWLSEEEEVWGTDSGTIGGVIGR
ncbi:hypothetical protein [Kitasatospora sp. NBC_01302]|uniref:hypothetical protein n=1 Tax=Kitasatospora sp. NBC_01302 TaxID=2903575 RepID=UPI002E0E4A53|nr:hypothetical protein OG294_12290 [Kitasatospora sp. NBC_01302]